MSDTNTDSGGSAIGTIFIVFVILKLTGAIAWSWWWVTSPLWLPVAFLLAIAAVGAIVTGALILFEA